MTVDGNLQNWLADGLVRHAAKGLRRRRPDWADAMLGEAATLPQSEQLRWAIGCAVASYRAPGRFDGVIYPLALLAGIALMAAYQWSADESLRTVAVIALIGGALGLLRPRRVWVSAATVGLVVAAVNAFETITSLRPAYEMHQHTFLHDARWVVLMVPALIASGLGGYVGRKLRSATGAPA